MGKKLLFIALMFMCFVSAYSQTTYYSKSAGNLNTLATWGPNTDGSGTSPLNFTTANCTYIVVNNATPTIAAAWTVSGTNSVIQLGDGTQAVNFTIPITAADKVIGTINVMNNGTLTINNATNPTLGTLASGSTVVYSSTAANQAILNANYYNLTLSSTGTPKKLASTANTTVTNVLNIGTGIVFDLSTTNADTAILNGTITGAGSITGGTSSNLKIGGTGTFGTLNNAALTLSSLIINRAGSGTITLANTLTIDTLFSFTNGDLVLNGKTVSLGASSKLVLGSGIFTGGVTNSDLTINSKTISGSLLMDQTTAGTSNQLTNLTLNSSTQTLTLGGDLIVSGAYAQTKGIVNLNGKTLTLNGTASFASSAANGTTTGSSTSNLLISATTLTNDLFMTPGSQKLNNFTLNSPGKTLILGAGDTITISGAYTQTSGTLNLNGQNLNLTGTAAFGGSTAGTITGSAASSLTVAVTSITNDLFLTGGAQTFKNFILNSPGQTLTFGAANNLTVAGAFAQTNGNINLNGGTLTLSAASTAVFPAAASNGVITGSATSGLSISSTSISNPLFMDQTTPGTTNLLKTLVLNSLGQTLTLGTSLKDSITYTQTAGIVNLNGNTLTLAGATTFPLSTKGSISGSAISNLIINATTLTDTLFLTAGSQTLNNFTLNSATAAVRTLNLGTSLTVGGAFTHTKGIIKLNGHTLTLNGTVVFPAASATGSFVGSATSNLIINASSITTNTLFLTTSTTLNNFTLNSPSQTMVLGSALTVSGAFNQTNGNLNLNGQTLTLAATSTTTFPAAASNGVITGSDASSLSISSTSITNPLFMNQTIPNTTNMLKSLVLNSPGQTLTLGNNLNDSLTYTQTAGIVNLNGNTLTLTGATTFALSNKGTISGSATSNLIINATTLTDTLFMTTGAQTLNNFTLNSAIAAVRTLNLGTSLTVGGTFTQTKGIIKLNGHALTLNGAVTFPTAAAQGTITGSTTSTLSIGATSITNDLFMTAGSQTLNNFILNSSGQTLILGAANNITVSGAFTQTNGGLNLNGNTLTLSGTITFPAAYSNGSITGSAASTLSITATGITNNLFMNQTTPGTTNELKNLTLNSTGQTLTLGNNLVTISGGTYTHTNGIVNLNGSALTLNGIIVFPAAISNGSYTGSSVSTISVGGAGNITNSFLMTQTSSATSSLSTLILNRTGKTITLGNALNVIDSICPTLGTIAGGGNITLIADQVSVGHAGRVGKVGGSLTGNITSQVYHNPPTGNTTNWMLMGSAGVTNATFAQWNSSFEITCPSGCSSTGPGGAFTSLTTYDEPTDTYPAMTGTASTIVPGIGYWVYLGTTSPGTSSGAELITVTGTPKTGTFTWPALTNTAAGPGVATGDNGYNLISNPYPSPISWLKVFNDPLNAATISAFPNLANMYMYYPQTGAYMSYNAASGIANPSSYVAGTNTLCDKIPAGGGFYVVVGPATGSATLKVSEGDKVMSGSDSSFLFRQANHTNSIQSTSSSTPYFSLVASDGTNSSEASIAFSANATLGNDAYDTPALPWNSILQITSSSQAKNYAVNALPGFTQNYTLPVKILSGTTTQYILTPVYLQNIPAGACLSLHDNYTNTDYDLHQGSISLTISDTETVARFVLNITIDNSLAVTSNFQNPTCTNSANGYMIASASGSGPWNYYWKDASNNIIKTTLNKSTADTLYNANAGNYHVDVNTSGLCNNGTQTFTLQGTSSPSALYTTPSATVVLNSNDSASVTFTNSSTNANTYTWDFGDGSQATTTNATHPYTGAGVYVVTLTAFNQACGESSVYTQVITVDTAASTTGIKTFASNENNMQINKDAAGYYVQFNYGVKTNAVISVQNLLGEKVVADMNQENVWNNKTYVPLGNTENNILIISVITSSGEKTFRKIINY